MPKNKENKKLNQDQIKNWRKFFISKFGSYGEFIPEELIQAYKDKIQNDVNKIKNDK